MRKMLITLVNAPTSTYVVRVTKQKHAVYPLIQVGGTLIHDKNLDFVFINPQFTFSIYEAMDLMISSQNAWSKIMGKTDKTQQINFTRLQGNF